MKRTLTGILFSIAILGLNACDKPTVVNVPATTVPVPGPAGPVGPSGDKGDMGNTGNTGDIGNKGQMGDTGEKGSTGDQGDPGLKGNSGEQSYNEKTDFSHPRVGAIDGVKLVII